MDLGSVEFDRLERLRARFLDADARRGPIADYWHEDADLEAYDAVFAERIGWKWDAVLDELHERGFDRADDALVVDWGCGTGVAARRFVARFGARSVTVHDRSPRARAFAASRLRAMRDDLDVAALTPDTAPDVLLISHVLNELEPTTELALLDLVARSRRVVWVEPGNQPVSRRLSMLRDMLREQFRVLAPCTHDEPCGAIADRDDQHRDWCHFFAPPPAEVFRDGDWVRLARRLGIDLRALPYAFLALERNGDRGEAQPTRLVGRPRVGRQELRIHVCDASGLAELLVAKRFTPDLFRRLRKRPHELRTMFVRRERGRIVDWNEAPPAGE